MSGENKKSAMPRWLAWLAICLLSLVWAFGALIALLFGGIGKGGHALADWAAEIIQGLSS